MAVEGCLNQTMDNMNDSRLSRFMYNFDVDCPTSPEMFASESEDENLSQIQKEPEPSPVKLTPEELILRSDTMQQKKINKFLSGVPPPPKITTCPLNCTEMLTLIEQNTSYFWINYAGKENDIDKKILESSEISNDSAYPENTDRSSDTSIAVLNQDEQSKNSFTQNNSTTSDTYSLSISSKSDSNKSKEYTEDNLDERTLLLYRSIHPNDVINYNFEEAYKHKTFGVYYNRNKAIEEFERLTVKLCERYITSDTQSTCNIYFTSSAAEFNLRLQRISEKPKSPGKRLNYLTKRRRTFSRANLQNLSSIDKKYRLISYKKPVVKKGKSPRGKSPRGKSPRVRTPRSSAKKRAIRKLTLEDQSPLRPMLQFPKRALFQSPPSVKDEPSQVHTNVNPNTIKRALFSTSEKDTEINSSESRKRKSDEPLERPCNKWPKSISFDCPRTTELKSPSRTERHSTDTNFENRKYSLDNGKIEMSSTHRKKLFWAVAETLRAKGIGMTDSRFKQYASSLARIIRKNMPDLENRNIPRKPGSTTDRMLKLAKHHVYLIMEGKLIT